MYILFKKTTKAFLTILKEERNGRLILEWDTFFDLFLGCNFQSLGVKEFLQISYANYKISDVIKKN